MSFWTKSAFASLILGTVAYAQSPSTPPAAPATSAMVSSSPSPSAAESAESSIKLAPEAEADSIKPASETQVNSIKPVPGAETESSNDVDIVVDPASLLPDPPLLPKAKATLIGGTVDHLDRVRDQLTVHVFGGGKMNILFDPRTHVYKGKSEASIADLQPGERVYLDTILDGDTVFARSIRLKAVQAVGESQGVVVRYHPDRDLMLRDSLSPTPVRVRLTPSTQFRQGDQTVPATRLIEGALVAIKFNSQGNGHDTASEISILALPGTHYVFAGQVVHIDLRTGLLVLNSSTDNKTYEVYLDPSVPPDDNLHVGSVVSVVTDFDGSRYLARNVKIISQNQ